MRPFEKLEYRDRQGLGQILQTLARGLGGNLCFGETLRRLPHFGNVLPKAIEDKAAIGMRDGHRLAEHPADAPIMEADTILLAPPAAMFRDLLDRFEYLGQILFDDQRKNLIDVRCGLLYRAVESGPLPIDERETGIAVRMAELKNRQRQIVGQLAQESILARHLGFRHRAIAEIERRSNIAHHLHLDRTNAAGTGAQRNRRPRGIVLLQQLTPVRVIIDRQRGGYIAPERIRFCDGKKIGGSSVEKIDLAIRIDPQHGKRRSLQHRAVAHGGIRIRRGHACKALS